MMPDLLSRRPHPTDPRAWPGDDYSDAADTIAAGVAAIKIPAGSWNPHAEHHYDGSCALCRAAERPVALRNLVDAVLDAALADPDIAAALRVALAF